MLLAIKVAHVDNIAQAFHPIGRCAESIIKANGFADIIHVIAKRSTELVVGQGLFHQL